MTSTKDIGMDVRKESTRLRSGCGQQDRDGMRHRNESQHDSRVFRWTPRGFPRHLRGRHLDRLAVRAFEAPMQRHWWSAIRAEMSIPVENSPLYRSKIPHPQA